MNTCSLSPHNVLVFRASVIVLPLCEGLGRSLTLRQCKATCEDGAEISPEKSQGKSGPGVCTNGLDYLKA